MFSWWESSINMSSLCNSSTDSALLCLHSSASINKIKKCIQCRLNSACCLFLLHCIPVPAWELPPSVEVLVSWLSGVNTPVSFVSLNEPCVSAPENVFMCNRKITPFYLRFFNIVVIKRTIITIKIIPLSALVSVLCSFWCVSFSVWSESLACGQSHCSSL